MSAIVFAHGYCGSAEATMGNETLVGLADALEVTVDADGLDWRIPGVPNFPGADGLAALASFDALRGNLIERFAVDPERIVAVGCSAGGMMVWYLACHRGDAFASFVPLSATFWAPLPAHCTTSSGDLIHYHGTEGTVLPFEGRPINQSRQGNVLEAIALFTDAGGYRSIEGEAAAELDCDLAQNDAGQGLELCLYTGGQDFSHEHLVRARRLFGLTPDD